MRDRGRQLTGLDNGYDEAAGWGETENDANRNTDLCHKDSLAVIVAGNTPHGVKPMRGDGVEVSGVLPVKLGIVPTIDRDDRVELVFADEERDNHGKMVLL